MSNERIRGPFMRNMIIAILIVIVLILVGHAIAESKSVNSNSSNNLGYDEYNQDVNHGEYGDEYSNGETVYPDEWDI